MLFRQKTSVQEFLFVVFFNREPMPGGTKRSLAFTLVVWSRPNENKLFPFCWEGVLCGGAEPAVNKKKKSTYVINPKKNCELSCPYLSFQKSLFYTALRIYSVHYNVTYLRISPSKDLGEVKNSPPFQGL